MWEGANGVANRVVLVDLSGDPVAPGGGGGGGPGAAGLTDAELRAAPLPVSGPLTDTQLRATPLPVMLPAGLATEATAAATLAALPASPIEAASLPALANPTTPAEWLARIVAPTLRVGSFISVFDGANGAHALELSSSPLTTGTDVVPFDWTIKGDIRSAVLDYSIAGRVRHSLASVELFGGAEDAAIPPIAITAAYQSSALDGAAYNATAGAYLTVTLATVLPNDVRAGDLVNVDGLADNRLGYSNCPIRYISPARTQIVISYTDAATLPSLAVTLTPAANTAFVHVYRAATSRNAIGLRADGTGTTLSAGYARSGVDARVTGALFSDQRVSVGITQPTYRWGLFGQAEVAPSSRFLLAADPDGARLGSCAADAVSAAGTNAMWSSTPVHGPLALRLRQHLPASASRAVAKIVAAAHATAATDTVVTLDITPTAAGLAVGRYVSLRGIANQTIFANSTTPAAITAIDDAAKTITLAWGAATAGTSYGGTVALISGGADLPGVMTGAVQSVAYDAVTGIVTLVANTNFAYQIAGGVGDHVELHGVRDAAGAGLGLDGCWRIYNLSGTTLHLQAVADISGARISPQRAALASTPAGGTVIQRTVQRLHRVALEGRTRQVMAIDGAGTVDITKAVPVAITNYVTMAQGTPMAATNGTLGWPVSPGIQQVADLASGAITTTTTSGPFALTGTSGGTAAFTVVVNVTAMSGTSPTMDCSIEVQDDGARWYKLYDMPRITAAGQYSTPELRTDGRSYRIVQTLGGTSPSFTRSIVRNSLPFQQARHICQAIDRTASLTTLGSATPALYVDGPADLHLVVNIGAATTPPALQLQVSEDNGATWASVGSPVTATASGTVKAKVTGEYPRHARAIVTTAGAGVTMGYVLVKAVG